MYTTEFQIIASLSAQSEYRITYGSCRLMEISLKKRIKFSCYLIVHTAKVIDL